MNVALTIHAQARWSGEASVRNKLFRLGSPFALYQPKKNRTTENPFGSPATSVASDQLPVD